MSIRVTCPGCHSRFNVSSKFAGKSGPCPKCQKSIKVPDSAEEVKVFEPESYGPKTQTGEHVLKPVFRQDTSVSPVQITLIVCSVLGFLAIALVMRWMIADPAGFPDAVEFLIGLLLSLPLAYAGYTFLRDPELAPFEGQELWLRLGCVALIYALLWLSMPLAAYAFGGEWALPTWVCALTVMLALGGATSMLALNVDFFTGILHYGFYLLVCVLGRWIADLGALPGMQLPLEEVPTDPATVAQAILFFPAFQQLAQILAGG